MNYKKRLAEKRKEMVHICTKMTACMDVCMCVVFHSKCSVRNSPGKVTCPGGKQVEKVACPP